MYETYKAGLPLPALIPAPATAPKPAPAPKPTPAPRRQPKALTLAEQEEKLTDNALEELINIRKRKGRAPNTAERKELAKAVVTWAEELGIYISEDKGTEIVNKAMARFAPKGK